MSLHNLAFDLSFAFDFFFFFIFNKKNKKFAKMNKEKTR